MTTSIPSTDLTISDEARWNVDMGGEPLSDRYSIERRIGMGGTGVVFQGQDLALDRCVAVKISHGQDATRRDALERFHREARAAAMIGHPHIVDVLDIGRTPDGRPYLVMEFLQGEGLLARLAKAAPLRPSEAAAIATDVLAAIGAAHRVGIVHRDIKPENVFLAERAHQRAFVKLLDFGAAKFQDGPPTRPSWSEAEESIVGTPAYMSPEQAAGHPVDPRSDLYAVGVLLYEMLSAQLPYRGKPHEVLSAILAGDPPRLEELAPSVPRALAHLVARAMARDPEDRFASAREMSAALERFALSDPSPPPSRRAVPPRERLYTPTPYPDVRDEEPLPEPIAMRGRSKPLRWIGLVVVLTLVTATAGLLAWQNGSARQLVTRLGRAGASQIGRVNTRVPEARRVSPNISGAPAASITVVISSNVPGAQVSLDGTVLGTTPLIWATPPAGGRHVLRVEGEGFVADEREIVLESDLTLSIDLTEGGERAARAPRRQIRRREISRVEPAFEEGIYYGGPPNAAAGQRVLVASPPEVPPVSEPSTPEPMHAPPPLAPASPVPASPYGASPVPASPYDTE